MYVTELRDVTLVTEDGGWIMEDITCGCAGWSIMRFTVKINEKDA